MRWLVYLLIVAPLGWFFGGVLWREQVLDFRDIGHYYRPLWHWTSSQWRAGRIPLWCDLDGLGLPIHADPTASIFYPGQLLFLVPVSLTTRVNLYVVLHLLLAAVLTYRTARAFGGTRPGAAAAALSYAYGGQVLFQYCNPIFLVGAAWLPLAILGVERTIARRSWNWTAVLASALALMILGGDMQLAYHVGLLAVLYLLLMRSGERPLRSTAPRLAAGLLLAGGFSAVQLLPTAVWSARSERAMADNPRCVWESHREGSLVQGLLHDPPVHSHHERLYDFSVGPWRWLEFCWPNIGGRMFPLHQRWMSALPAEGRIWSPSLYLGLAPALAALAVFSLRRRSDAKVRWLSWMTLVAVLASLGIYGVGWLVEEVRLGLLGGDPHNKPVFGAVGGLYWFFVVFLPGYVQFRYPAKWMVVAALGISLLASHGWEDLFAAVSWRWRFWRNSLVCILGGSVVALVVAMGFPQAFTGLPDEYPFGPLDAAGARRDVVLAALHAGGLLTMLCLLARYLRNHAWLAYLVVGITAVDLGLAHGWMISASGQAPETHLPGEPAMFGRLRIYRGKIDDEAPQEWSHTASRRRVAEVLAWQYASLGEKCFLAAGINVADALSTLEPADVSAVWNEVRSQGEVLPGDGPGIGPALAITARLAATDDASTRIEVASRAGSPSSEVYAPREVLYRAELSAVTPETLAQGTHELFYPRGLPADRREQAVVEVDGPTADLKEREVFRFLLPDDALRLLRVSPTHLEIDADLPESRLVVLADYYAPGWQATIVDRETGKSRPAEILRTNRVLRGIVAPAGKQTIIVRYRPWSLYLGAVVSALAWGGAAIAALVKVTSKKTKRTKEE